MSGNMSASDSQRMIRKSEQERMKQEQVFPGQCSVKGVRRNVLSWPEGGSNAHHALEIQKEFTSVSKCSHAAREQVGDSDVCSSFLHQVCVYNELYRILQMLYSQSRETKIFTFKKEGVFVRIIG